MFKNLNELAHLAERLQVDPSHQQFLLRLIQTRRISLRIPQWTVSLKQRDRKFL